MSLRRFTGSSSLSSDIFGVTALSAPRFPLYMPQISISVSADAVAQVEAFAKLGDNWDGYGSLSIEEPTIKNARDLLERFNSPSRMLTPIVTPHPNGIITFEWESPSGEGYLEIGQTQCCFYIRPNVGETLYWTGSTADMKVLADTFLRSLQGLIFPSLSISHAVSVSSCLPIMLPLPKALSV